MFNSLRPNGLQYARPSCPSPTPGVYSNSYPLSQWCHSTISSSVVPFSSHLQSFPASGSFRMSQLFASSGQNIRVSASTSVLPVNIQDSFPLEWTGWISLQSKGLLRIFSNTTVQKRQFFSPQLFFSFFNFILFKFTILYWFCHISKWVCHRYTCVPHHEPSSLIPPHTIPLGRPSAPAPSIQYRASNLDWRLVSYMILNMFQCHSPKSSHPLPLPLPQSPKDCSIHECLFCCLVYRVIVTIFLNSIYMH